MPQTIEIKGQGTNMEEVTGAVIAALGLLGLEIYPGMDRDVLKKAKRVEIFRKGNPTMNASPAITDPDLILEGPISRPESDTFYSMTVCRDDISISQDRISKIEELIESSKPKFLGRFNIPWRIN